jgi:hypothetical protein
VLFSGKPEGKGQLGRPRYRWMNNSKTDLGEIGWSDMDWVGLAHYREEWMAFENAVINFRFHKMLGSS